MFWKKRKNRKERAGKTTENQELAEIRNGLSGWTWPKRLGAAAIAIAVAGSIGYGLHTSDQETERKSRYQAVVKQSTSRLKEKRPPAIASEACMKPGSKATVLEDYISLFGVTAIKEGLSVIDGKTAGSGICIRPGDGGQDVSLESRIHISGLKMGDFKGLVKYAARLTFRPAVPDILPHNYMITGVSVNGRSIPLPYVTKEGCACRKEGEPMWLDIAQLVEAGILSDKDFESGLEIKVNSRLSIDRIPPVKGSRIAGTDAYRNISDEVKQYTQSEKNFPSDHKKVQKIVAEYGKKHDNVLEIMRYALDVTNSSLDYYLPELHLDPVKAMADGRGDCDDFAGVFITLLRGFGIPAREVEGHITNYAGTKLDGKHAWVEALVPFKDSTYRWVLVEPTWADKNKDPYNYINFVDNRYIYKVGFSAEFDTDKKSEVNILQEHSWVSQKRSAKKKSGS